MPFEMGKLISLQTLGLFVVGKESGCGITELKDLQHLKGELVIYRLEHVKNAKDAGSSNLILKHHLQSLDLCWVSRYPDTEEEEQAKLLVGEGLQPHPNLKRLTIYGYGGARFPVLGLVKITHMQCYKCEHLPPNLVNCHSLGSLNCVVWIQ
ncbi:hypothetical protein MKW92_028141 [Papaver armeniacum]|nr:hypothetical protein MKW92_028141 [Papaver armeniacum]